MTPRKYPAPGEDGRPERFTLEQAQALAGRFFDAPIWRDFAAKGNGGQLETFARDFLTKVVADDFGALPDDGMPWPDGYQQQQDQWGRQLYKWQPIGAFVLAVRCVLGSLNPPPRRIEVARAVLAFLETEPERDRLTRTWAANPKHNATSISKIADLVRRRVFAGPRNPILSPLPARLARLEDGLELMAPKLPACWRLLDDDRNANRETHAKRIFRHWKSREENGGWNGGRDESGRPVSPFPADVIATVRELLGTGPL